MAAYEAEGQPEPFIPEDSFAVRLIVIRKALRLTQAEAAALCGFDDGSWSNWENGTKPRGMDRIVSTIAERLNVDRDWLMWGGTQNRKFLTLVDDLAACTAQGSLLDDDGSPLDFFSRPELVSV